MTRRQWYLFVLLTAGSLAGSSACGADTTDNPASDDVTLADGESDAPGDAADVGIDGAADSPPDTPSDGGLDPGAEPDAGGEPDADEPAPSASGVTAVGSSTSLDIAAWNVSEFPLRQATVELVADVILALDVDVVALIEVDDPSAFTRLTAALPGWDGLLPTLPGGDRSTIGIVNRRATVDTGVSQLLFTDDTSSFPRPPLQVVVEVLGVNGATAADLTLIVVHLKAGTTASDESRRLDAMVDLEAHVRALVDGSGDDEVMVIGDFNEAISDPNADNVFAPWTDEPARYRLPTLELAEDGTVTYLPAGIMLDHVVYTSALDEEIAETVPVVPRLDQQVDDYEAWISDHLPVVVLAPALP